MNRVLANILKINFPSYKYNFTKRFLTWLMHFLCLKTVKTKAISRGVLINETVGETQSIDLETSAILWRDIVHDLENNLSQFFGCRGEGVRQWYQSLLKSIFSVVSIGILET